MPVVSPTTTTNDRLWMNSNPKDIRVAVIETSIVRGCGEQSTCSVSIYNNTVMCKISIHHCIVDVSCHVGR